jgi:threonine dehydrogenase-like Zn-dependent dehydrogenase
MVINPGKTDAIKQIMDLTEGYGCDIYIEATGHPSSVIQGMQMIRKLGTFVEFSVFSEPTTLDWSIIGDKKELNVLGSHISPYTYPYVLEGMAKGIIKTNGVVTKMFPLERWEEAFHFATGKEGDIKVAFRF